MGSLIYSSIENLIMQFKDELKKLTKEDFHKCFTTWIKRCENVILKMEIIFK